MMRRAPESKNSSYVRRFMCMSGDWGKLLARVSSLDHALVPGNHHKRLQGMIAAVCAEEFVARPSYMGCQRCDYGDLCEVGEKGDRS